MGEDAPYVTATTVDEKHGEVIAADRGGVAVEVRYMGTDADRHDMTILGRKQVLRVRASHVLLIQCHRTNISLPAKLPNPANGRFRRCADRNMGAPFCVKLPVN